MMRHATNPAAARQPPVLDEDHAFLYVLRPESVSEPSALAACLDHLSAVERARMERFVFPAGRREYLLTRALVRVVLAEITGLPPRGLEFVAGARGRPELATPVPGPRVRFNVSHTRGVIACVVTSEVDVGVDVEDTTRPGETLSIADSVFSPAEVRALRSSPTADQRDRFFTYWTLKEAYIKARGLGLAIPLDRFTFDLGASGSIAVRFDPSLGDDERAWQFELFRPTRDHLLAVGLRTGGQPRRIVWREPAPLLGGTA